MNDDQELNKFAYWLFSGECKFIAGAANKSLIPKFSFSEIAFIGRSNVGKSSLINKLTNRSKLARVSHTPGATKQINFFSVRDKMIIVDLPGHGYAKVSKTQIHNWSKLIIYYLQNSVNLKRVFLLIDSRRGIMDNDRLMMNMLDNIGVLYQIILTKSDKISLIEQNKILTSITNIINDHQALYSDIILTSSRNSVGIEKLRLEISKII